MMDIDAMIADLDFLIANRASHSCSIMQMRQWKKIMVSLKPRPLEEWHEDMGDVLWWKFPIEEPPYIGSPLDLGCAQQLRIYDANGKMIFDQYYNTGGWPGYHTHWTPLVIPQEPKP